MPVTIDRGAGVKLTSASESSCPVATYGPQFYAPTIPSGGKTVALTFDDGPGPSTPAILAILEEYGVRATFFNVGLQELAWPANLQAEARAGFLVGNHTFNHPDMTKLSRKTQAAELDRVINRQEILTGTSPCVFRPPYGDYDATTLHLVQERHMAVWMWSVDTEDWEAEGSSSAYWVDRIVSLAESEGGVLQHPVVLFHNGQIPMPATVAALPVVIQYFKSHGYTFVDLLGDSGPPAGCSPQTAAPSPSATLVEPGQRIGAGASVDSPGGQYRLVMQTDGNLVLSVAGGRDLWASGTEGSRRAYVVMEPDGDLVIFSHSKQRLWETGTQRHPGAELAVQSGGGLVIYDALKPLWSAGSSNFELGAGEHLDSGWYLQSPAGECRLVMKRDGNLTLYSANGRILWASGTAGSPGAYAVMETDGNLVVDSATNQTLWESRTDAKSGARLVMTQQAEAAIELSTGSVIWQPS
jgi:peptidoglycan/xylan/chitin deacetylase (PgdA/CDA1 family)